MGNVLRALRRTPESFTLSFAFARLFHCLFLPLSLCLTNLICNQLSAVCFACSRWLWPNEMAKRADKSSSSSCQSPLGQRRSKLHSILNQFTFGAADTGGSGKRGGERERERRLKRDLASLWKMHTCYGNSIIATIAGKVLELGQIKHRK